MFRSQLRTKKDVDKHVRTILSNLRDNEVNWSEMLCVLFWFYFEILWKCRQWRSRAHDFWWTELLMRVWWDFYWFGDGVEWFKVILKGLEVFFPRIVKFNLSRKIGVMAASSGQIDQVDRHFLIISQQSRKTSNFCIFRSASFDPRIQPNLLSPYSTKFNIIIFNKNSNSRKNCRQKLHLSTKIL